MTNIIESTIVSLMIIVQTNWTDSIDLSYNRKLQVGRLQTNYIYTPESRFYPVVTSESFFSKYYFVREVEKPSNIFYWTVPYMTNMTNITLGWTITNEIIKTK